MVYNATLQDEFLESEEAAYLATASEPLPSFYSFAASDSSSASAEPSSVSATSSLPSTSIITTASVNVDAAISTSSAHSHKQSLGAMIVLVVMVSRYLS